jgi:CBS domain-containing protein
MPRHRATKQYPIRTLGNCCGASALDARIETMKAIDVMSAHVRSIEPTRTIADAANIMAELDVGVLPVIEGGELVGIVTDRDLALRGFAAGMHAGSPVLRVMSAHVQTCQEDADLDDVLEAMGEQQVRRMPVCSNSGDVVGMISIGDLARRDPDKDEVAETLSDICRPAGLHCQRAHAATS